jgi:hypothetical protein
MEMIPGIEMKLGRETYIVPTLSLAALELYVKPLEALMAGKGGFEAQIVVIDAAHAAIKRNYPDITRDTVAAAVDVATFAEVVSAILDVGGVNRKKIEASKAAELAGSGNVG